jgi:hypothetical protein
MATQSGKDELHTTNLALVLKPEGITLDASGRVVLKDPQILQAILSAATESAMQAAPASNWVGCGGNAYQCGKV